LLSDINQKLSTVLEQHVGVIYISFIHQKLVAPKTQKNKLK